MNVQFQDITSTGSTWDFDANTNAATPATSTATTATTQYSAIDRYDIGLGANLYAGFHNISFQNTIVPNILSNATTVGTDTFMVCQGDFTNFESQFLQIVMYGILMVLFQILLVCK